METRPAWPARRCEEQQMSDAAAPSTAAAPASAPSASPAPAAPSSAPASTSTPAANGPPPATSGEAAANSAPAAEWKRKVKIDGREVEVDSKELPAWFREAAGEEEALSTYRLRAAAQARMKEAAELRKQSEAVIGRVKNPEQMMDALLELHDGKQDAVDRAVEAYYAKRLRESEMTPEQRELEQYRRREADRTRQEQERVEQQRQQEAARLREQYAKQWQAEFPEAAKGSKLPWSKPIAARMVQHARAALEAGEQVDAKAIARDVAAELREEWEAIHGSADDDALLGLIGEERMKRIRARDVERLKAAQMPPTPPPATREQSPQPRNENGQFASQKLTSTRDFFQRRRGLL
jgi:hypothetical protein